MKITDRELRGRAVIAADGRVIGKVEGLILDSEGPGIGAIQVELRKNLEEELGLEHHVLRASSIEVPFTEVQSIGDTVVLAIPIEALRKGSLPMQAST